MILSSQPPRTLMLSCQRLTGRLQVEAMSSRSKDRRQGQGLGKEGKKEESASDYPQYVRVTSSGGVSLAIRAKPGAKRAAITDISDMVGVAINAPPRDGEANEAVLEFMAEVLGVKKRQVTLSQGSKSREKVILVEGSSPEDIQAALRNALTNTKV